jgi:hypothetical protein
VKLLFGKWSIGQFISGALLLLFLAAAGKFFYDGAWYRAAFKRWSTDTPIALAVDFSKPGLYTGVFTQTCSSAHSQCAGLVLPSLFASNSNPAVLFSGLYARLDILEKDVDNTVRSVTCSSVEQVEEFNPLFHFAPFKRGTYRFKLQVLSGATNLSGIPQRLEGQYALCGMEALPGFIGTVLGFICTGLALVSGTILAVVTRRRNKLQILPPEGQG